jgi:hypothetical protein
LNTLIEISNKITQCSQNDRLEIIISLRAFLFDDPVYYWIDFTYSDNYEADLINCQIIKPNLFKKINEDNIKKIGIKPIDLFLLPRNKKLYLINLIEEIFEDLQLNVVYDKIRLNPFHEDVLFNFIKDHQEQFSKNIIETYQTRNKDLKYLLEEASIEHQIYETCFVIARKNKIIDYWTNIWGGSTNYKDSTLIEHLIIK